MSISTDIFDTFASVDEAAVDALLLEEIRKNEKKIVILDDDPTGGQTLFGLNEYTNWSKENVRRGFAEENKQFYILTNSRGLGAEESTRVHKEVAKVVHEVSQETGIPYIYLSRSDSTLRGHYPLEMEVLSQEYTSYTGKVIDGEILCPFFKEGGRYTIHDIHYVRYGQELVPAGETEFAKDPTFGYRKSNLKEYVEEKTEGRFQAESVTSISLEDLRALRYDKITEQLLAVKDFNKIFVNAIDYIDLKIFCVALYRAMAAGKVYMVRTAASLLKVIAGIPDRPLLSRQEMIVKESQNGGVIVVGSHTNKTTEQLRTLQTMKEIEFVELNANLVVDEQAFQAEIRRCLSLEEEALAKGKSICVYTSRQLITAKTGNKEDELALSVKISKAVQSLVGELKVEPAFVIAKGGNTSADIARYALGIQKAYVLGQIKPGIPVWQADEESKYPGVPYVVFPGNVGDSNTLREAVEVLLG